MRRILLDSNSRYILTPFFSERIDPECPRLGERNFWGTFVAPDIPLSEDDSFERINDGDNGRLDLLAYKYYGSPALWWVIALVNEIFDPLLGLEPGEIIRIPRSEKVFQALSEAKINA